MEWLDCVVVEMSVTGRGFGMMYIGVGVVLRLQIAVIDDDDRVFHIWGQSSLRRRLHSAATCHWPLGELPRQQVARDVVGCDVLAGGQHRVDVSLPQHPHQQWPGVGSPGAIATQSLHVTDGMASLWWMQDRTLPTLCVS